MLDMILEHKVMRIWSGLHWFKVALEGRIFVMNIRFVTSMHLHNQFSENVCRLLNVILKSYTYPREFTQLIRTLISWPCHLISCFNFKYFSEG